MLSIEMVLERREAPAVHEPWAMLDVCTQNRRYAIDPSMRCIRVYDIASDQLVPDHGLLASRVIGGQRREGETTLLTHPYPQPGDEAVFEQSRPQGGVLFSHSSPVERVVLRLRRLEIPGDFDRDSWERIAQDTRGTPPGQVPGSDDGQIA